MNIDNLKGQISETVFNKLNWLISRCCINTAFRLASFLGQCAHESGNFKVTEENLNYSGDRLLVIFPKYFKGLDVKEFNRNPQKIANKVYANRMGNGDEASGDGYKYRGRGYIQLTGKNNYNNFKDFSGYDVVTNPDLLKSEYALESAAWFYMTLGCNKYEELTDANITSVTKIINGGVNGLEERKALTKKYYNLIKD